VQEAAASRHYLSSYHENWDEPEEAVSPSSGLRVPQLANATKKQAAVESAAQVVLEERARHPLATLADLYDPLTMPAALVDAHATLDRAVDRCYRSAPFTSDRQRVEYLFALYERYTNPLLPAEPRQRRSLCGCNLRLTVRSDAAAGRVSRSSR